MLCENVPNFTYLICPKLFKTHNKTTKYKNTIFVSVSLCVCVSNPLQNINVWYLVRVRGWYTRDSCR